MRVVAFLLVLFAFMIPSTKAIDLQARFDHCVFYSPQSGAYLETYLQIEGYSVKYLPNEKGVLQAKVEITQIVRQGEKIIDFKKYELAGPEIPDSVAVDIKDQQRFGVEKGIYTIEVEMKDLQREEASTFHFSRSVHVQDHSKGIHFGDIQLLESLNKAEEPTNLTKAGYDLVPLVDNFYPQETEKIAFYTEIYNSNRVVGHDERFLLKAEVQNHETKSKMSGFGLAKKYETGDVVPVLSVMDIEALPTGNYNLILKVIDRSNEILTERTIYFQRLNPIANLNTEHLAQVDIQSTFVDYIASEDSLDEYIACLRPITSDLEKRIMDKSLEGFDHTTKKQFFFSFWKSRNPADPEDEWLTYLEQVREVEQLFATKIRRGYETDRGRVYLRYGKPDYQEARPNEPSSYPYEMWQYYKIDRFNNRVFVFYLPDLVTEDYVLLHSDMQGEVQNYRWQTELVKRNTPFQDIDAQGGVDHFGGRAGDVFDRNR